MKYPYIKLWAGMTSLMICCELATPRSVGFFFPLFSWGGGEGGIQRGASLEGMEKGVSWVFFQPVCRIYHFRYSGVLAGSEKGHMDWIDGCRYMTPDAIM